MKHTKRIGRILADFVVIALMAVPSYAYQTIIPYPGNVHIVTMGDHIMNGYGMSVDQAFPESLGRHLRLGGYARIQTMNVSDNNDTVLDAAEKVPKILGYNPHIVIISLGSNDAVQKRPLTQVYERLEYIIKTFTDKKVKVILAGVSPEFLKDEPYKTKMPQIYNYLAYKYQLEYYPNFLEGVEKRPIFLLPDGLHPNLRGTEMLAQNMKPVVEKLLSGMAIPKN